MATALHVDYAPWTSGTSLLHQRRLGRTAFAERLIGSIRRECVDHFVVLGEAHLRQILQAYAHMLTIIMTSEHIGRWVRMRRFLDLFSEPGSLIHMRYLASFIIITSVSRFSVHTITHKRLPEVALAIWRPAEIFLYD